MKGLLSPEWKRKFHFEGLDMGIVDLNKIIQPKIAIIDATYRYDEVTCEHIPIGLLIVSYDPVAADTVGSLILGLDPLKIDHISLSSKAGLGEADINNIDIVGESLNRHSEKYNFSKPINPFDIASKSNGKIEIIQGKSCSACLNELGNDLAGIDLNSNKNIKILVDPEAKIDNYGEDCIVFQYGNCIKNKQRNGILINGCPPGFLPAGAGSIKDTLKKIKI